MRVRCELALEKKTCSLFYTALFFFFLTRFYFFYKVSSPQLLSYETTPSITERAAQHAVDSITTNSHSGWKKAPDNMFSKNKRHTESDYSAPSRNREAAENREERLKFRIIINNSSFCNKKSGQAGPVEVSQHK